jgi:serine/threonine-protein kinase RsbW
MKAVRLHMELPAEAESVPLAREQAECLLRRLAVSPEDTARACIVVTEACANAVRHAYDEPGHTYHLDLECHQDRLVLRVVDRGKGFDADRLPLPRPGQLGGYGVYLIRQISDKARFDCARGRSSLLEAELTLHSTKPDRSLDRVELTGSEMRVVGS